MLLLGALVGLGVSAPSGAITQQELDEAIRGLTVAESPRVLGDWVIFSYRATVPARYVGARFEHEEFRNLHVYQRNEEGVLVLAYKLPEELDALRYRVVVDGQWSADPFNPRIQLGVLGFEFSVLEVPPRERQLPLGASGQAGAVTFRLKSEPDQTVAITGDFSSWDPLVYPLREAMPGLYEVTLPLPAGAYAYTFVINGRRVLDPANPVTNTAADGRSVSWVAVGTVPATALSDR